MEPTAAAPQEDGAGGVGGAAALDATATPQAAAAIDLGNSTLLVSLLLPVVLALIVFVLFARRTSGGRRKLVLFGPVGAGKTALFHQLRYGRVVPSVSSMELTSASFVPSAGGGGGRPIHAVDVPGSGRLRARMLEEAASSSALVCVVDGTQLVAQAREAAGMLYEVLTHEPLARRPPPLLIAVNKQDGTGAATPAAARKAIEQELQRVRLARTTMEDTSGRTKAVRGFAASDGPFTFDELSGEVSFAAVSATKPDVAALLAFAHKYAH